MDDVSKNAARAAMDTADDPSPRGHSAIARAVVERAVLIVVLVVIVAFGVIMSATVHTTRMRLGAWIPPRQTYEFTCPKGFGFQLVAGFPKARDASPQAGRIIVWRNETRVAEYAVSEADAQRTGWLSSQGLDSSFLAGSAGSSSEGFYRDFVPGDRMRLDLELNGESAEQISVWLCFLQRGWYRVFSKPTVEISSQ